MMDERYSRQAMLPDFADFNERAAASQVGILGLGGLGGLCAYLLVGAGIKRLKLADADTVSLSNLHRQILYTTENLQQSKTACACARLKSLDPKVELTTFDRITEDNFASFAEGCTLILDLTDNMQTRLLANRKCLELGCDYIHASIAAHQGMLSLFRFSDPDFIRTYGCYECMSGENASVQLQGITGPYAAALSAQAANLAMQYLSGCCTTEGKLMLFDFKNYTLRKLNLHRTRHCLTCQSKV